MDRAARHTHDRRGVVALLSKYVGISIWLGNSMSRYWKGRLGAEAVKAARFSKAIQRIHYAMVGDDQITEASDQRAGAIRVLIQNREQE